MIHHSLSWVVRILYVDESIGWFINFIFPAEKAMLIFVTPWDENQNWVNFM